MANSLLKRRIGRFVLGAVILTCAGCAVMEDASITQHSMLYDNLERTYHLLVPDSLNTEEPAPLVIALHGGGGKSLHMCRLAGGITELASEESFLVVCPQGIEQHWNDWRSVEEYRAQRDDVDDVGFILALIDRLNETYNLDRDRVYITGNSNGGMMTLRMMCESPDTFAAAAALIASMPIDGVDCPIPDQVSILFMNGTEDPLIQWEGGTVRILRQEYGETMPVPHMIALWTDANGCELTPRVTWLPDADPDDETRIWQETYQGCHEGSRVVVYGIEGGGHTWPGGAQYAPRSIIGRTSTDAHAGELIWDFFSSSTTE